MKYQLLWIFVLAGLAVADLPTPMTNELRMWIAVSSGALGLLLSVVSFVRLGSSYRTGRPEAILALFAAATSFLLHTVLALSNGPLMFRSIMVGLAGVQFFLGFLIVLGLEELMRVD